MFCTWDRERYYGDLIRKIWGSRRYACIEEFTNVAEDNWFLTSPLPVSQVSRRRQTVACGVLGLLGVLSAYGVCSVRCALCLRARARARARACVLSVCVLRVCVLRVCVLSVCVLSVCVCA